MTKPMGPIPAGYAADQDAMLLIGGRRADALVTQAGDTPLFVYDLALVDAKIAAFRAAFPGVDLHYAMKANPYPPLLRHIAKKVDGLDVASAGEMDIALEAGVKAAEISFAGPGKRDEELSDAIHEGVTLNAESEGEVERALVDRGQDGRAAAARRPRQSRISRSGARGCAWAAAPSRSESTPTRVPALVRRILDSGAEWRGFHIFAGSQALEAAALIEAQTATVALAASSSDAIGAPPPLVNLGGGFGIPHFHGEQPLDLEAVAAALAATWRPARRSSATRASRSSSAAGSSARRASI